MNIFIIFKWQIYLFFISNLFVNHSIAQSTQDTSSPDKKILKPKIKAGNLYIGLSPFAIFSEYYAIQPNIEIGIGDNMSIATEIGWILGNKKQKEDHFIGNRFRPSIRLYSKNRNLSYDFFFNYREASIKGIDKTLFPNKLVVDRTSGIGIGINHFFNVKNRINGSIGIGFGIGNGYVEYTPIIKSSTGPGWGSGFEAVGDLGSLGKSETFGYSTPTETGRYTHPIGYFNFKIAYQIF
jgi:hypothetical protein